MNEIIKAILERRTCRSFTQEAVTLDQVKTILDCALAAPSGMCKQTWKFTAVVNPEKIQRLAAAVGSALNRGPEQGKPRRDSISVWRVAFRSDMQRNWLRKCPR